MNDLNQPFSKNNKTTKKAHSLEVVKDADSDVKTQAKAATVGVLKTAVNQLTNSSSKQENKSQEQATLGQTPFNFAEFLQKRESKVRFQERAISQHQKSAETLIFHRKEEQAKQEIELIKDELKKLVKSTGEMSMELMEAEKTVMTTTVAAGTYHINFFERIRRLIRLAKKKISESKNWLEMFNSRNSKKSFYWNQAQKSGSKFTNSQERVIATSVG